MMANKLNGLAFSIFDWWPLFHNSLRDLYNFIYELDIKQGIIFFNIEYIEHGIEGGIEIVKGVIL